MHTHRARICCLPQIISALIYYWIHFIGQWVWVTDAVATASITEFVEWWLPINMFCIIQSIYILYGSILALSSLDASAKRCCWNWYGLAALHWPKYRIAHWHGLCPMRVSMILYSEKNTWGNRACIGHSNSSNYFHIIYTPRLLCRIIIGKKHLNIFAC